jgi:hypothetical protein
MKTQTIKSLSEIKLAGIVVDGEVRDGSIKSVRLTDQEGRMVQFCVQQYDVLNVAVPTKPKMVKKWAVRGTFMGLPVDEVFPSFHAAEKRRDGFNEQNREQTNLDIEEVQMPEDQVEHDEIPF